MYVWYITDRIFEHNFKRRHLSFRHAGQPVNRLSSTLWSSCVEIADTEWQAERQLLDSHTASPVGVCTVHCIASVTDYSLICHRCVKHTATYVCFVNEYAFQINWEDFYCGNLSKKRNYMSNMVGNLQCGFIAIQFTRNKVSGMTSSNCVCSQWGANYPTKFYIQI